MTQLCTITEIPDESAKGFELAGRKLFAVRKAGQIFIYENRCPHKGIPLEWMPDTFLDPEKQFIQCSTHGALFTIDAGLCIAGPCNGAHLKAINFKLDNDQIILLDETITD